jgi:hypothetical protein
VFTNSSVHKFISVTRWRRSLVTANVVPTSAILVTLMIVAVRYSETSVLTRAARFNIKEDGILQNIMLQHRVT